MLRNELCPMHATTFPTRLMVRFPFGFIFSIALIILPLPDLRFEFDIFQYRFTGYESFFPMGG